MIRKSGSGVEFSHTLDEEVVRLQKIAGATDEEADTILDAIGIQVLSWIHDDYQTKSRGGTDPGGVTWKPLKRESVRGRLNKLQSYRNASPATKRALVDAAVANHQIGIDTSRLINSLDFGRASPDTIFELSEYTANVGTVVQYAGHYAALRPIIHDRQITPQRQVELDEIVQEIMDQRVEKLSE